MAGWDDVPVIEESDVSADELIELPANGWGQLVGWVAGVKRLRRVVDRREHMTTLYYRRASRPRSRRTSTPTSPRPGFRRGRRATCGTSASPPRSRRASSG
jgi:hypothetical protein